ncbi:hypothetical protein AIOL_000777 [Candidatus Rhodobacter oscarellae]|uniref:Uncharacterized protein n=2 Tax=Candidatus Rhodobacter oscarellae TaxID=1675527 RepID=A0A0J9H4W6_9RHOB|nr:hypothetical protein AIOL_000777 [Candidatus Rhodobacter lobularis]
MENWSITIQAPMGEIRATLAMDLAAQTGEMSGKNGSGPMTDLVSDGDALSWSTKIEKPMPMTLKFKGTRDGDAMAGKVKFGVFASGTFSGERMPTPR